MGQKPPNWRRPSGYDSSAEEVARRLHDESGWEPRAPLGEKAAAVWWPSRNADAVPEETLDDLLEAMDGNGINISLVMPAPFICSNDEVARFVARAPDEHP